MKISELIKTLESLKGRVGDTNLNFFVKDHYSVNGKRATLPAEKPADTFWYAAFTNGVETSVTLYLDTFEDKEPLITYRKQ
jgi:hypothetical protein